jgi:5'-nucleotidase
MTRNIYIDLNGVPNIYLDLDGVMADFDAHFRELFGLDNRSMADEAMWEKINSHPTFFRDMPVCEGALAFFHDIERLYPTILTGAPSSNFENAARQKRAWVYEHLSEQIPVIPVRGGKYKPLYMSAPGDILIDDYDRNTRLWTEEGGVSILHRSFDETRKALEALIY